MAVTSADVLSRWCFIALCVIYAAAVFMLLCSCIRDGRAIAAAASTLLASTLPITVVTVLLEDRPIANAASLADGSWAFLIGDAVFLPLLMGAGAAARRRLGHTNPWYDRWWSLVAAVALGVAVAAIFRDAEASAYAGSHALRYNAPTKLVHEFVAYPVLFAASWYAALPTLVHGWRRAPLAAIIVLFAVAGWFACGLHDTSRSLDPADLHPQWDWSERQTIVEPINPSTATALAPFRAEAVA